MWKYRKNWLNLTWLHFGSGSPDMKSRFLCSSVIFLSCEASAKYRKVTHFFLSVSTLHLTKCYRCSFFTVSLPGSFLTICSVLFRSSPSVPPIFQTTWSLTCLQHTGPPRCYCLSVNISAGMLTLFGWHGKSKHLRNLQTLTVTMELMQVILLSFVLSSVCSHLFFVVWKIYTSGWRAAGWLASWNNHSNMGRHLVVGRWFLVSRKKISNLKK